jgi:hypothetical protein
LRGCLGIDRPEPGPWREGAGPPPCPSAVARAAGNKPPPCANLRQQNRASKQALKACAAGLSLFLASAAARAQGEGGGRVTCEAQALAEAPHSLSDAELRSRAAALLEAAGALEAMEERGVRLRLPWLAEARADLSPERDRKALEKTLQRLAGRLLFSCGIALQERAAPASVDPVLLRSILSRPEYELRSRDETFLYRLFARIATWFRDVFSTSEGVRATTTSVRTAFLVSACLVALFLAVRTARTALARRRPLPAGAAGKELALDDPSAYRAQGAAALAQSDGRAALRLGLLTLLATLERLRLAAPGRAATNREVAEQVAARGGGEDLARRTREIVLVYDRAWYGLSPVKSEEARAFIERVQELCALAAAERGGRP